MSGLGNPKDEEDRFAGLEIEFAPDMEDQTVPGEIEEQWSEALHFVPCHNNSFFGGARTER